MRMIRLDGSDIRECSRRCLRTVPDLDGCEISAQGVGKRLADQKQLVLCCLSAILFSSFLARRIRIRDSNSASQDTCEASTITLTWRSRPSAPSQI